MRFLIDECLTVELVSDAGQAGYEAYHLVSIGKAGWPDRAIVPYAVDGDLILVTNNAGDFRPLYRRQTIHPGLIIILPNVESPMQRRLFFAKHSPKWRRLETWLTGFWKSASMAKT